MATKTTAKVYRQTFMFEGHRYDVRAKTKAELREKVALKRQELEKALVGPNTLVKEWAQTFLYEYKAPTLKGRGSFETYETRLNKHLLEPFGSMKLSAVKPLDLQKHLNTLSGKSQSHITKVYQCYDQFFRTAKVNRLISENPVEYITKPHGYKGTHRSLTAEERQTVLKVAEYHRGGLWVLTMLYCGLRPEETTLIQGEHIADDILHIPGTKNENAERIVFIPDVLRERMPKISDNQYLFHGVKTDKLTDSARVSMWKDFKREMNITLGSKVYRNRLIPENDEDVRNHGAAPVYRVADDLTPYCFRHTFCTDLQSANVPLNVAKELMGHSDISLTANIYTHCSDMSFNAARDAVNAFHNSSKND